MKNCNPLTACTALALVRLCLSCTQVVQTVHSGLSSAEHRERTTSISLLAYATQDVGMFCCTSWAQQIFHEDLQVFCCHATFHSNAPLCAWVLRVIPPQGKDFCTSLGLSGVALKSISAERLCFS